MKIHIDKVGYKSKPKESISVLKPRTQSESNLVDVGLDVILESILQGKTISPAVMIGGCKAENWTEQQLFLVDIDNEADELLAKKLKIDVSQLSDEQRTPILRVDEALEILKINNLQPSFCYYSFSHTAIKPKYRIGFVMAEAVTEKSQRAVIIETLINLFDQADKSCRNADRIYYGTNKNLIFSNDATIQFEDIIRAYKPPEPQQKHFNTADPELDRLKREFDFFGYLQHRNGETVFNNLKCAMFMHCELCGHSKDLVFYHQTNTFKCFGAGCGKGGTIIDYLMALDSIPSKDAILKFKHELLGLPKVEFSQEQKRDYAINKRVTADTDILERLEQINPCGKYQLNDKGFGELFADVFADICRYNVTALNWYSYNGKIWVEDTGGMIVQGKAKKMYDALLKYATTIKDDYQKDLYLESVMKFGNLNKRETMIKDARDKYFISQTDLDANIDLFNCQNGTLNLKTFEFKPHSSSDLLSKIANVTYNPTAKSDEWEKFIDAVMQGDTEKKEYLQKVLGYSLTAETNLETAFILYGATTRNGKSTLVETIAYMLGNSSGYALNMLPQTLAQKQNNDSRQASGDIARLKGCRFLNASEPPKRMMFDVALLKTLLGRDSITARHLHQREFEFIPYFKLFINTNFLPLITDDTLFTSGRINVITFDKHFSEQEQDKSLKDRLKEAENLSGVLNWLLEGLKKFRLEGATPPTAVRTATAEYRSNSDKIGNFISECLERTGKNSKASDIYSRFSQWCNANGFGCENKSNFFDELKAKNILARSGTVKGVSYQNVVIGYEIIQTDDDPFIENPYKY